MEVYHWNSSLYMFEPITHGRKWQIFENSTFELLYRNMCRSRVSSHLLDLLSFVDQEKFIEDHTLF